jgi:hypothetical protein
MSDQFLLFLIVAYPIVGFFTYCFIFWDLFKKKWFNGNDVLQLFVIIFVFGVGSTFFILGWPILAPIFYFSEISAKRESEKWKKEETSEREKPHHGMSVEEMMSRLSSSVAENDNPKTNK